MSSQFARTVLRVGVAQICQSMGWNSVQATSLEILTDILERYLQSLANVTHRYSEQTGRCDPELADLHMALRDMGVNIGELADFLNSLDGTPSGKEVPCFPAPRPSLLKFPKENGRELSEREECVYDHLPPMYPEIEDNDGVLSSSLSCTPRGGVFDASMDTSPAGGEKRPLSATGEAPAAKRQKTLPEEAEPSSYEMKGVVMSELGLVSPVRTGRLPDARTPQGYRMTAKPAEQDENRPPKISIDLDDDDDDENDLPPSLDTNKEKMKSRIFMKGAPPAKAPDPTRGKSREPPKSPKGARKNLSVMPDEEEEEEVEEIKEPSPEPVAKVDPNRSPEDFSLVIAEEEALNQETEEEHEIRMKSIDDAIESAILNAMKMNEEEEDKIWSNVLAAKAEPITVRKKSTTSPPMLFTKAPTPPPVRADSTSPPASPSPLPSPPTPATPPRVETPSPLKTPPPESPVACQQTPTSQSIDESIESAIKNSMAEDAEKEETAPKDIYAFDEFDAKPVSLVTPFKVPSSPVPAVKESSDSADGGNLPKIPKITVQTKSAKGKKLKRLKIKSLTTQDKGKKAKDQLLKKLKQKAITGKKTSPVVTPPKKGAKDIQSPDLQPKVSVPMLTPEDIKKFEFPSSPTKPEEVLKPHKKSPEKEASVGVIDDKPPLAPLKIGISANKFGIISSVKEKTKKNKKKDKEKKKKNKDRDKVKDRVKVKDRDKSKDRDKEKGKNKSKKKEEKHREDKPPAEDAISDIKPPSLPKLTLKLGGLTKGTIAPVIESPSPLSPPATKMETSEPRPEIPKLKIKPLLPPRPPPSATSSSPPSSPLEPSAPLSLPGPSIMSLLKPKSVSPPPVKISPPRQEPAIPIRRSPTPPPLAVRHISPPPITTPTLPVSQSKPPKKKPYKEPLASSSQALPPSSVPPAILTVPTVPKKASPGRPPKKKFRDTSLTEPPPPRPKITLPPKKSAAMKAVAAAKQKELSPPKVAPPSPVKSSPPAVQGASLAATPVRTVITETVGTTFDESGQQIWICPTCKKPDDGSPMVGCDLCDDWYHWSCVGIQVEPPENQEWFCPRCSDKRKKKRRKKHRD